MRFGALLLVLLAGCSQAPVLQEGPAQELPEDESWTPTDEELAAALAPPPFDLSNTTYFYWAPNETPAPAAYEIILDLREDNQCELRARSSYTAVAYGTNAARMINFESGYSWSASGQRERAYAHGSGFDTRTEELPGSGGGGGTTWWVGTFSGEVEFTFLAMQPAMNEFGGETYWPVAITVECAAPFSVEQGLVGADVAFFDPDRAPGELGAGVTGTAEAGRGLSWRHDTMFNESRLVLAGFGQQIVEGNLVFPGASQQIESIGSNILERYPSSSGTHGFDINWTAADFYALWGAVLSFGTTLDLHGGLHDEPTVPPNQR